MSIGNFSKPERRKLGSIGTLWFKGQPFKKTDIVETGKYPCLHYGELFSKYGAIIDSVSSRCDVPPKRLSQKGDILFPASDVTPAGLTRCSAIMQEDVILGGDVIGFRPQTGLNPIYLSYAIRHQKDQLLQRVTGALIKHISAKSLQSVIIPIHPIESQNRFEKQVCHLNRIISHRRTQLAKLDELVKCRFVELFGDMRVNTRGWENKTLGEACDVRDGTHDSPKYHTHGYPLVTSKNVTQGIIDFADCNLISEEDYVKISKRSKVDKGDIIMPMIGTVGCPVIVENDAPFAIKNVALIKFPDRALLLNIFVKHLLLSSYFETEVMDKVRGGTQKFISLSDIRKLSVFIPPVDLQNTFASFVRRIDKLRFVVETSHNHKHFTICGLVYLYANPRLNLGFA